MTTFATLMLPKDCDVHAPDGSEVRLLASLAGGSMAHFCLDAGRISHAVRHRTVEEIWFVLSGSGEMWRSAEAEEAIVMLAPGLSLTIPVGTKFQFRSHGDQPLTVIAITIPPWPGDEEAEMIAGPWKPDIPGGC